MTRQALALSLLEEAGSRGVTTAEFMDAGVGSRYSARLLELRKQGHRITSERVREGSWRYTLTAGRTDARCSPSEGSAIPVDGAVTTSSPSSISNPAALSQAEALKLFESVA